MTVRQAVRVLLVDPDDRLLLVRLVSPDTGVAFWAPVGGGIEPGETPAQAAVREVAEETGFEGLALGPQVYSRRVSFTWRGVRVEQAERWYLAHVPAFTPSDAGWTEDEREDISALRWWSAEELEAADEPLAPRDLAARLAVLLRDGPPAEPVPLGF